MIFLFCQKNLKVGVNIVSEVLMVSKFGRSDHELVLFQAMIRFSSQSSNFILVANDQGLKGAQKSY